MNPLVKDMLETAHSHDIELRFLEDLFAGEAQCEAVHGPEIPNCSITATDRVTTGEGQNNICLNCFNAFPWLARHVKVCPLCGIDVLKCWTITPI